MSDMPNIIVRAFSQSENDFQRYGRNFLKTNEAYRGYQDLMKLVESYDLSTYDLFEAVSDEVVAGVAAVKLVESTLYFDIFAVDEGFRGIGVGDALFEFVAKSEKYKDATRYESMALPGDRSTKNFFEQRQGKARLLIVGGPIKRD